MKHALKRLLLALGLASFCAAPFAVFDPVNDDTDLFRNNPNFPASRPNVLILLDNTANWSSGGRFEAEKTALVNTFAALDSSYNVGLAVYTQGGNACTTANVDGMYVRFGIRQLTTANKTALNTVITGFNDASCGNDAAGDQGSSSAAGQAMHEAYLYFGGLESRSGITQKKRDYAGSLVNTVTASLAGNPFTSITDTTYESPVTDACAKNYIIFITNGPFDNGDNNTASNLFAHATTGLIPNASGGVYDSWADEYSDYLANTGVNNLGANQKVFTYAVEVDPVTTGQGPDHTNLLKSMATRGKGKYFGVTSANSAVALTDALLAIFQEIQAVNSVFAASTLPVSVNVRGTNLNQLYIGVFRPDALDRPYWLGNLKAYQLRRDPVTNTVFTVDSLLAPAINSSTGFITSSAKSFWTTSNLPIADYWAFRSADVNGAGGNNDSPDGDLVEKGGAAQQLRSRYYANTVNGNPARALYTCTQGPAFPVCNVESSASPSALSATPFRADSVIDNADIDAGSLGIYARSLSSLTAALTKPVTQLIDRRTAALDNTAGTVIEDPYGASITNDAYFYSYADWGTVNYTAFYTLDNSRTVSATLDNGAVAKTATKFSRQGSSYTDVTLADHGYVLNQKVIVTGTTNYNTSASGVLVTNVADQNNFRIALAVPGGTANETTGTVTTSSTTVTATANNHGFTSGQTVTIAGASPSSFNGAKPSIVVLDANTFTFTNSESVAASGSITASAPTNIVTATLKPGAFNNLGQSISVHGYSVGQTIAINNASPTDYNGTYTVVANSVDGDNAKFTFQTSTAITTPETGLFSYVTTSGSGAFIEVYIGPNSTYYGAGPSDGLIYADGSTVHISGATPSGYNGAFVVSSPQDFSYTDCCTPAFSYRYYRYSITVPDGTPPSSGRANAAVPMKIGTATSTTVTATLANHRFTTSDTVTIEGATSSAGGPTGSSHNGSWAVTSVVDANTFQFSVGGAAFDAPSGTATARLSSSPRAYATIAGHGYGATDTVVNPFVVAGADPAGYNGSYSARVEDANTVSYPLSGAVGTNTGVVVTATTESTTAVASLAAHGFVVGDQVAISGATPGQFNGGSLTVVSTPTLDTFTYTITPAAGAATGAITALAARERSVVIDWIRGQDNYNDENADGSYTDTRATMHGDVLHSRPAVVNYNRRLTDTVTANIDNDVYIFYGGNDGVFRAVKGGFGSSTTTTYSGIAADDPTPGQEVWGFVAKEHFASLSRLRTNAPGISSTLKKPYFFDGPLGVYTLDANGDGMLDPAKARATDGTISSATTGDKVWLFLTMRRGGRAIYAIDVSDPLTPKMLWRKGCPGYSSSIDATSGCDTGWAELGQTWSEPKVVSVTCTTTPCGTADPVLMFGAGYDQLVEDPDPACITALTTTSVTTSSGNGTLCQTATLNRTMGRGLFVVNARTGDIIWHASPKAAADVTMPVGATYKQVVDMNYAIPSDIAVVVGDPTPKPFRAYVGDTGGQLWRFDFGDTDPSNWTVVKLASIADHTTTATDGVTTWIPGQRKFQFAPDVIGSSGFDMVMTGSGDREHPFDTKVVNRVYGFKDKQQTASPVDGGGVQIQPVITHATAITSNGLSVKALLDVTTQCIEKPASCSGTAPEIAGIAGSGTTPTASENTSAALTESANTGWFITLLAGEKQVGSTLASGSGVVQFGTNQPSATASSDTCSPNLGVARQYQVNYLDGTAYNGTTLSTLYTGGGYLPSPVLVYVGLGGTAGTGSSSTSGVAVGGGITGGSSQLTIGAGASTGGGDNVASAVVCYGASCSLAPGTVLFSRLRKFWYKEID